MIKKLTALTNETLNIIVCCTSPTYRYLFKKMLKETFNIENEYCVEVEKGADLTIAKKNTIMPALIGDKWLIEADIEKLGMKDVMRCLGDVNYNAVNLIYVKKYKDYKYLTGLEFVKKQGIHTVSFYLNKLEFSDLMLFIRMYFGDNYTRYISNEIIGILRKEYLTETQDVFDLLMKIKSGLQINSRQDLIRAIGVGRNSIVSLVIDILLKDVKTERGIKKYLKENLQVLKDMSLDKSWHYIRKAMVETLDNFIMIKEWMIMGSYGKLVKNIPENVDEQKMLPYLKYDWALSDKISLKRLLQLRDMLSFENLKVEDDMEIVLMRVLYKFYSINLPMGV